MTLNPSKSDGGRFDAEGDWLSRKFFSDADLRLSPEEYIAHYAHAWALFSFHLYRYQDPVLRAWVRRVGELLFAEEEVERCRHRFLSPEELAKVREEAAGGF